MSRIIMHIDMDAFYASIEQRDNPQWRGKPVVVGSPPDQRGVVATASYEARQFGVRSAMPSSQAGRLCPHAIFVPVNMEHYLKVSREVMRILYHYTPVIEQISVDEAFIDLTGSQRLFGEATKIGREIHQRITKELSLPSSVGIASNKFIAKVASEHCKPQGFLVIEAGKETEFLHPLPVSDLWGVGKVSLSKLNSMGIYTVGQVAAYSCEFLEHHFGLFGTHLYHLALGLDDRPVTSDYEVKSVSAERTYDKDATDKDKEEFLRTFLYLAEDVGTRARSAGHQGRVIQIKVRFENFETLTHRCTLQQATDCSLVMYQTALALFDDIKIAGRAIRLLGLGLSGFEKNIQPTLFDEENEKISRIEHTIDALRKRFGSDKIKRGRLLENKNS